MTNAKKNKPQSIPEESRPAATEETVSAQAQEPTKNDLDSAIRRALARPDSDPQSDESDESDERNFLAKIADANFMANLSQKPAEHLKDVEASNALQAFPDSISNFEPIEMLGSGGMGRVFKVRHQLLGQIQAVKLLHGYRVDEKQAVARFKNEMRAIGALKHPNIVSAQHAEIADGVPYLVMDYVQGQTLSQILQSYRQQVAMFPIPEACEYIRQAAVGLQYAHDRGIVHRDIKPGNIMVDEQGQAKILDLGLARIIDDNSGHAGDLTTEEQILGTPNYMAPEQLTSSRSVDARADVYALGATLYQLLTGEVVYPTNEEATFFEKASLISDAPVPDIRALRPDIPAELGNVITQCLQKSADDRVISAGELAERLASWTKDSTSGGQGKPVAPTKAPQQDANSRGPRSWLFLLAFLFPFILLAGVLIRLQLPGGGELVIECDDPNATFNVVAVQGDSQEELKFSRDQNGSIELKVGTWQVDIQGLDADQYKLSKDQVVISKGKTKRLRATRRSEKENDKVEQAEKKNVRFELPGYASYTSNDGSQPSEWQIIPKFVSSNGVFEVSPSGKYVVAFNDRSHDPYTRILERKTGRLVGVFFHPTQYERFISWSPDETKFVIHFWDWNRKTTAICRPDGSVVKKWKRETKPWPEVPVWSPDGSRILLISQNETKQLTADLKKADEFVPLDQGGDVYSTIYAQTNAVWSPDGSKFAIPQNGQVRIYDKNGGVPITVIKDADGLQLDHCVWHPDGERILTNGETKDGELSSARLWTMSGEFVRFGFEGLHETIIAFSPDGSYFVTNHGYVRDLADQSVANFEIVQESVNVGSMIARWVDQNRMIFCKGSGYSTEFSPSGEKLAEFNHPAPVAQEPNPWLTRAPSEFNSTMVFNDGQEIMFGSEGPAGVDIKEGAIDFDRHLLYINRNGDGTATTKTHKQFDGRARSAAVEFK